MCADDTVTDGAAMRQEEALQGRTPQARLVPLCSAYLTVAMMGEWVEMDEDVATLLHAEIPGLLQIFA